MSSFDKHVKLREEKHGAVIFDTLREKVFVTNETAAHILRLMEEGLSAKDIADRLAEEYQQDPDSIQQDVVEFIEQLKANELTKKEEKNRT